MLFELQRYGKEDDAQEEYATSRLTMQDDEKRENVQKQEVAAAKAGRDCTKPTNYSDGGSAREGAEQ